MLLADDRIILEPRPTPALRPVFDVVMLGHCPGAARWDRLGRDRRALAEIAALGFAQETRRLAVLAADQGQGSDPNGLDQGLLDLYGLPIPIYSLGQFQALFPDAFTAPTGYRSRLAGALAWLPPAVQDFFDGADPLPFGATRLWIIRVDEALGAAGFLPDPAADLLHPQRLAPFERALLIPRAGILALPDLERLQIPANLADVPRVRLPNPQPVFLPVAAEPDDGHRERRYPQEVPDAVPPLPPQAVIPPLLRSLGHFRPDLQCLLTLPLDPQARGESPQPDQGTLDLLAELAGLDPATGYTVADPNGELFPHLRQIQFLYPYLRGPGRDLSSTVGLIAGAQAQVAARLGPWRSVAGRPLPGRALPYPVVGQQEATRLRESPGLGVLVRRNGAAELDDERLAGPVLAPPTFLAALGQRRRDSHYRSGEVARLLGWLRRELTDLGERVLFDVDPGDPRPALALRRLFTQLHARGALRGALPEDAFRLLQVPAPEGVLAFDIELAPALPIDRIRISFAQNRNAGAVDLEVSGA